MAFPGQRGRARALRQASVQVLQRVPAWPLASVRGRVWRGVQRAPVRVFWPGPL